MGETDRCSGLGGAVLINDEQLKHAISKDYNNYSYPSIIKQLKIEIQYRAFNILYRPAWYWPVRSAFHSLSRFGAVEGNFNKLEYIVNRRIDDFSFKIAWIVKQRLKRGFKSLNAVSTHSRQVSEYYQSKIKSNGVIHPTLPEKTNVVFARYPLRVKQKNHFLECARKENIELADWYATPIHPIGPDQFYVIGYKPGSCPNARKDLVKLYLFLHIDVSTSDILKKFEYFLTKSIMGKINFKLKLREIDKGSNIDTYRQLASIHKAEINEGFLPTLGLPFLTRLYQSLSNSPHSFLIVAEERKKIVGFICGGIDTSKVMRRFVMRYGMFVLPKLIVSFLSLKKIQKILETLFYPTQKINIELPKPEILNFCVSKEYQRQGIGGKLFFAFIDKLRQLGIDKIKIVTGENQKKAQNFYESMSAKKVADIEIHKGVKSSIYIYEIL